MREIFIYKPSETENISNLYLAGAFNQWNTRAIPLEFNRKKEQWETALDLEKGEYPYKFVDDRDRWYLDFNAKRFVQNSIGNLDSVVIIGSNRKIHNTFSPSYPKLEDSIKVYSTRQAKIAWNLNRWENYRVDFCPSIATMEKCRKKGIYEYAFPRFTIHNFPEVITYSLIYGNGEIDDNRNSGYWIPLNLQTGGQTVDLSIESRHISKKTPVRVYLPKNYHKTRKKFSLMILLHGYGGSYDANWTQTETVKKMADIHDIVPVWPDGRVTIENRDIPCWYINSPKWPQARYKDYIVQELLPFIQKKFRVAKKPENTALAGISMGGFGAFHIGSAHPELFSVICAMSGVYTPLLHHPIHELNCLLGKYGENIELDCKKLIRNSGKTEYWLIAGDQEGTILEDNNKMAEALSREGISHFYRVFPGDHSNNLWRAHTRQMMDFAASRICSDYLKKKENIGPISNYST